MRYGKGSILLLVLAGCSPAVEQGKTYYRTLKGTYRERMLVSNFIREAEALDGEEIVGFYGAAHIGMDAFGYDGQTVEESMARRLLERYGERLHLTDLSAFAMEDRQPERTGTIQVGEKSYEASYFGEVDISTWSDAYVSREFWRLEGAYDDFRDAPMAGSVLPYDNYPTRVQAGQVFVIDYTRADGTVERQYMRADGGTWQGMPTTVEFIPPA